MKTKLNSVIAAVVSAAIAVCTSVNFFVSAETEETEPLTYTVSYNWEGEGVTVTGDDSLETTEHSYNDIITVPSVTLVREDAYFSGWTIDNILLYEGGDSFAMPEKDIVFEPVWSLKDAEKHTLSYSAFFDDVEHVDEETLSSSAWTALKPKELAAGQYFKITIESFMRDGYAHLGWTDGINKFKAQSKVIMPDHDVVLEPDWRKYYTVIYRAGDVDRIVGASVYAFNDRYEGNEFDLASSDRLSRTGFKIVGWQCDYDGQSYSIGSFYTMPASNVTFTAIWAPKTYTVVFRDKVGSQSESIKISGETDSALTCPDCALTNPGYIFVGWKYEDDETIYKPGDDFIVPGALPGLGIMLTSVWMTQAEYDEYIASQTLNALDVVDARKQFINGEITAEELQELQYFIIGRQSANVTE